MKFIWFVNSVLLPHDVGFLNKFRLVWKLGCIPSHIYPWITTAITRHVREIVLCVENSDTPFQVCRSLFNCGTLQSLELEGYMFVSAAIPVCLPRLESLILDSVCFKNEEAFEKLISGCTMLKYLHVRIDIDKIAEYILSYEGKRINAFKFVVSSTSLRRLELYIDFEEYHTWDCLHSNLELDASSLEYLKLVGYISRIHVQESLSSLLEADFGIKVCECEWDESGVGDSLMKALHASSCVKALTLSDQSMWALNEARCLATTVCWPTKFKRLVKLKAGADCCHTNVLQDLMLRSDSLEVLRLDKMRNCPEESDKDHAVWNPCEEVPRCLSYSLKTVEYTCYAGFDYELEMVGYMLEHGSALQVMKISCDNRRKDRKYEFLQEICKLPRKSPTCKIEFSG